MPNVMSFPSLEWEFASYMLEDFSPLQRCTYCASKGLYCRFIAWGRECEECEDRVCGTCKFRQWREWEAFNQAFPEGTPAGKFKPGRGKIPVPDLSAATRQVFEHNQRVFTRRFELVKDAILNTKDSDVLLDLYLSFHSLNINKKLKDLWQAHVEGLIAAAPENDPFPIVLGETIFHWERGS
ncbi:hypothetical protein K438DRAFT_1966876 [Mycena galopus ATCC 62051]|nr:hypothetical protein K438DRAFT_1966876 [Mycena galopus ATCC 62051]